MSYQNKLAETMGERYVVRPGEEWHHTVPRKEPWAADLRAKFEELEIDINDPRNAVFLPRNASTEIPLGKVLHSQTQGSTFGPAYGRYLKDQFKDVTTQASAFVRLERIRSDLVNGIKP